MHKPASDTYDFAISGDGCSGFLLLEAMSKFPDFKNLRVLIVGTGDQLERSWCFWDETLPPALKNLVLKSWSQLSFNSTDIAVTQSIAKQQYYYIPGQKFLSFFREDFVQYFPNVSYIKESVVDIKKDGDNYLIQTNIGNHRAKKVYNSLVSGNKPKIEIWQHFRGWFIETETPCFHPDKVTLMDFSVSQDLGCCFMYVLPHSERKALVEITFMGPEIWEVEIYENMLTSYIDKNFSTEYSILDKEFGKIPMQQGVFQHIQPNGVINLGTAAGMVKPSTGYAFQRIRKDSEILAEAFFSCKTPSRFSDKGRFAFYDSLLLWIIKNEPHYCRKIFSYLFKSRKMSLILRFLDQKTSIYEEIKIFSGLPLFIFLKALVRTRLQKEEKPNLIFKGNAEVVYG